MSRQTLKIIWQCLVWKLKMILEAWSLKVLHTILSFSHRHGAWKLWFYDEIKTTRSCQGAGRSVLSTIVFRHKKFGFESYDTGLAGSRPKKKVIHFSLNRGLEEHFFQHYCKQGVKIKVFVRGVSSWWATALQSLASTLIKHTWSS